MTPLPDSLPTVWYHGTPALLKPGALLLSPSETDKRLWGTDYPDTREHVYITPALDLAVLYADYLSNFPPGYIPNSAEQMNIGYVYRVRPIGEVSATMLPAEYRCRRARVLERVRVIRPGESNVVAKSGYWFDFHTVT